MNFKAFRNTIGNRAHALPILILYVTEECNLRCLTCSYRSALPGELTLDEIKSLAAKLKSLGLQHIVYSGGEPLLRRDFTDICESFASIGVKQSLLTNGLLLEKRISDIHQYFNEIIVSIDGADAETHNKIRGINSFDQILKGIRTAVELMSSPLRGDKRGVVSIRSVIQRNNFRQIIKMVELAYSLKVSRISFLPADVTSDAFGREHTHAKADTESILLNEAELNEFKEIISEMFTKCNYEFQHKFISESPEKILKIADYFEAYIKGTEFPLNPCNAPNVSAVITSTGDVLPCYFLPAVGNIRKNPISELINTASLIETRQKVNNLIEPRCKTCVCTLKVSPKTALMGRF